MRADDRAARAAPDGGGTMTWLPPHRHTIEDCRRNVARAEAAAPDPVASPRPSEATIAEIAAGLEEIGSGGTPAYVRGYNRGYDDALAHADPVATPAPLDVQRLARALHIGGVTTGGASHPESCNSTWHLEQANRVGFLYDNAITTRLEGQPVAEGRE